MLIVAVSVRLWWKKSSSAKTVRVKALLNHKMTDQIIMKIKLLGKGKMPTRSYKGAGYDLYAAEEVYLFPGTVTKFKLGIATEFSEEFVALILDRSSMGAKGIHVFGAVVDSDYRGEWHCMLYNSGAHQYLVKEGDKVCQVVFTPVWFPTFELSEELSPTERGAGGFGSSGK
jgi:dUTP pyrophosphatase